MSKAQQERQLVRAYRIQMMRIWSDRVAERVLMGCDIDGLAMLHVLRDRILMVKGIGPVGRAE